MAYTIVGDVFTLEERPRIQGVLSTVWGVASLAGPFLGGFLIDTLSWHWVFFINLPFGVLSVLLLQRSLKESYEKKRRRIDYKGAAVLTLAMLTFMSIFLSDESFGLSRSVFVLLSALAAGALLFIFWLIERRVREPIVPFDVFSKANILVNLVSFLAAAILIGNNVYMPIYIQNVLGYGATVSGLSVAAGFGGVACVLRRHGQAAAESWRPDGHAPVGRPAAHQHAPGGGARRRLVSGARRCSVARHGLRYGRGPTRR